MEVNKIFQNISSCDAAVVLHPAGVGAGGAVGREPLAFVVCRLNVPVHTVAALHLARKLRRSHLGQPPV